MSFWMEPVVVFVVGGAGLFHTSQEMASLTSCLLNVSSAPSVVTNQMAPTIPDAPYGEGQ